MNQQRVPVWVFASIVLTAALSLYSISLRYRIEARNKAVTIALEYDAVESHALASGLTVSQALQRLKAQGLGAVVLTEETVGDLVNSGEATIQHGKILPATGAVSERIVKGLSARYGGSWVSGAQEPPQPIVRQNPASDRSVAVGLNPQQAERVRAEGLQIVARMGNPAGVNGAYVRNTLQWAHELGAMVFLPLGEQVLGRRDALKDLTEEIQTLGMLYASPEFTKLGGDANVLAKIPENVVRLHAAQAAELDKLPLGEAVDRYSRAANERGMRILLVRPLSYASQNPFGSLSDFVTRIHRACLSEGLHMGAAHPYEDAKVPQWLFLLIGLSIVPAAYFAGTTFDPRPWGRIAGLLVVLAIGASAITHSGREFAALLAAMTFPYIAFVILDRREKPNIVLDFVMVCLISLVGGLAVAGLLNGLTYTIRADQFFGVKLAVFLPIGLVAYYFVSRGLDLREVMKNPITWGAAALALVALVGLMFMSSRTGNDNPAGVSDLELKMRYLLDQILLVRPRTKELLIGHPLLIIGIGMLAWQRRTNNRKLALPTALALAGGAIGQTDIVNTLCHIHTPVLLSLMRIGVGMVAGCIIGLAAWAIVKRWLPAGDS